MPITRSQTSKNEEDEQKRDNDPLVELLQKEMKKLQTQVEHRMTQMIQEQREYLDTKLTTQERYIADNYKKLNEAFISRSNSRDRTFKRREDHVFDDDFESEYVPRERLERNNDTPKPKFPSFSGKNDPDAYLDWEEKMEAIFACYNYSDEKKVTYAVAEFINYALTWWNQLCKSRILYREQPVTTWVEMKRILRKRFVPPYYYRELHQRLQHLVQGDRSVDDYYKEMETIQIIVNLVEEPEVTMARFLAGLKPKIANRVELQHYMDVEEMLQTALTIEKQLRKKGTPRGASSVSNPAWRGNWQKQDDRLWNGRDARFKPNEPRTYSKDRGMPNSFKGSTSTNRAPSSSFTSPSAIKQPKDITCFKCQGRGHYARECPNKKSLVIREDGEVDFESDNEDEMPPLEDADDVHTHDEYEEYLEYGEKALVARRALNVQFKEEGREQRDNIFHTRCLIGGQPSSLIIDSGSCTNVVSSSLVEKLGLPCVKHPRPYRLQWLNDSGEVKVSKQCLVSFSIGRYSDKVLCDVVPIQAGHILL